MGNGGAAQCVRQVNSTASALFRGERKLFLSRLSTISLSFASLAAGNKGGEKNFFGLSESGLLIRYSV
jgi:hypothetical protein